MPLESKKIINVIGIICTILVVLSAYRPGKNELHYNSSGLLSNQVKHWWGTTTPNSATGNTINISSAGFTTIIGCSYEAVSSENIPVWVKCTGMTNTQVTYSVYQGESSIVLLGSAYEAPENLAAITIRAHIIGY